MQNTTKMFVCSKDITYHCDEWCKHQSFLLHGQMLPLNHSPYNIAALDV